MTRVGVTRSNRESLICRVPLATPVEAPLQKRREGFARQDLPHELNGAVVGLDVDPSQTPVIGTGAIATGLCGERE